MLQVFSLFLLLLFGVIFMRSINIQTKDLCFSCSQSFALHQSLFLTFPLAKEQFSGCFDVGAAFQRHQIILNHPLVFLCFYRGCNMIRFPLWFLSAFIHLLSIPEILSHIDFLKTSTLHFFQQKYEATAAVNLDT